MNRCRIYCTPILLFFDHVHDNGNEYSHVNMFKVYRTFHNWIELTIISSFNTICPYQERKKMKSIANTFQQRYIEYVFILRIDIWMIGNTIAYSLPGLANICVHHLTHNTQRPYIFCSLVANSKIIWLKKIDAQFDSD